MANPGSHVQQIEFRLKYDGPALQAGTMRVREFAPALLAVADLIEATNHELYGDRARVDVKLKADIERGSFTSTLIFDWVMQHPELFGAALAGAPEILSIAGLVRPAADFVGRLANQAAGKVVVGLVDLVREMKGEAPAKVEPVQFDGIQASRIETHGGDIIYAPHATVHLYQTISAREDVETITRPLDQEGVESLLSGEGAGEPLQLEKADRPAFRAPPVFDPPSDEEPRETMQEGFYKVYSASLNPAHVWRFRRGDETITARIEDKDFFEKGTPVTLGSTAHVRLRVRQEVKPNGDVEAKYAVEEIISIRPPPRSRPLFPTDNDELDEG